jgi:type VI secretion system secreted protein VgrG
MAHERESQVCRMTASSGLDQFLVRRFWGRESVSAPFWFDLELVGQDLEVDLARLIGTSATFEVVLNSGALRHVNGVVDQVRQLESDVASAVYHLRLVPWTRLLELRTNCRVYQGQTVPDIVDRVLSEHGAPDIEWRLEGEYQQRLICVQYRESDWAFIARLLEEEGIAYHFEHEDGRHVLVFCDRPGTRQPCPEQPTALYRTSLDAGDDEEPHLQEVVKEFRLEQSLHSGRRLLADFNYLDPGATLEAMAGADLATRINRDLEDFEYPGGFVKLGDEEAAKLPFGETLAAVRAEAIDARTVLARGESSCRGFQPGFTFELLNHPRQDCRIAWHLLEVAHNLDQSAALSTAGGGNVHYDSAIVCLPAATPFRPPRLTPRPVVKGPQTAIVTGPSGEEIYTDKHGRVKVAFHWDRDGARDGTDSCFVRVAHGWAGAGWGMQFTPRIGQEVVVEFLEGDPDRPLITGSVYNGRNAIPFGTPTQSGIRTRSSKEGAAANCNEIRFEDKKGSEDLFMQAEKTLTVNVKDSSSKTVGTDQRLQVGKSRDVSVEDNESVSVGKNQSINVGSDQNVSVGAKQSVSVGDDQAISVEGKCSVSIAKDLSLSAGAARKTAVAKDDGLNVGGDRNVSVKGDEKRSIDKNSITTIKDGCKLEAKKIAIEAKDELVIKVGKATLEMKKNGDIQINGKKIQVKGSGDVVIKGSKIGGN